MRNTLGAVFDTARSMLQGGETTASTGLSNAIMQQFFNVAYPELWQIMGQVQTARVRRDFFHYLPAYTTYFDPQSVGVTDFGEPEWMEERGGVTVVPISTTSNASPIVVTTTGAHGLASNTEIQIAEVTGTAAPEGMWFGTVLSSTTLSLNGSVTDGSAGTGGSLMSTPDRFQPMSATRNIPFNSPPSSFLRTWQWQDNALRFIGATQAIQLHVTYWASGVPPTNVNTTLGIDDCMAFLSTRVASLAARSRGWYQMAEELKVDALGPNKEPDGSGGLLRAWLNLQVINMQATEFRKPPFRTNLAWNFPGDYIYGSASQGDTGGSVVSCNRTGWHEVPITNGNASIDLSLGDTQHIAMTGDTVVLNYPRPVSFTYRIVIDQDATGGRSITFGTRYLNITPSGFSGAGTPANSRTIVEFSVDINGDSNLTAVISGPTS